MIVLFALAIWSVPKITEGWYRDRLQNALEDGLGRKVEIGQRDSALYPTPGLPSAM